MKYEKIREGLIEIFNSYGYEYKMFNTEGKAVSNPYEARYFFVEDPNMMFIVDDEENRIEFHRSDFNFKTFKKILNMVRRLARKYFVSTHTSNYNKTFRPKDFSTDVRRRRTNIEKKFDSLNESCGNGINRIEGYDTVLFVHYDTKIVMSEGDQTKFEIPSSLDRYVPYLLESYYDGSLSVSVLENLDYLVRVKKTLDEKAKHGNLEESETAYRKRLTGKLTLLLN